MRGYSFAPHCSQNCAPFLTGAPQEGQYRMAGCCSVVCGVLCAGIATWPCVPLGCLSLPKSFLMIMAMNKMIP